ncbi:MAG: dihydroorotase, partial [Thermoleophilaceae bacterium]|nr:dihydroorotase [Thermoleophilaceae bacterium]
LRNGALDFIATDHAPHSREEKEQPLETAPFGIIGLETAFSVLYTKLVLPGVLPLGLIVERMSAGGPWFGIDLPALTPGNAANITLVDLSAEWQVGEAGYESRSANSPWAGETLTSRVRMTVAAGTVAYRERSFAIGAVA